MTHPEGIPEQLLPAQRRRPGRGVTSSYGASGHTPAKYQSEQCFKTAPPYVRRGPELSLSVGRKFRAFRFPLSAFRYFRRNYARRLRLHQYRWK